MNTNWSFALHKADGEYPSLKSIYLSKSKWFSSREDNRATKLFNCQGDSDTLPQARISNFQTFDTNTWNQKLQLVVLQIGIFILRM